MLKAGVFHLRLYAAGHNPFRVGKIVASGSQGSRNGNLGLEDGTALRLERQISVTYFQLAHQRNRTVDMSRLGGLEFTRWSEP